MLSVKQGDMKYHFLGLWYDSTGDWTLVSGAVGEYFTTRSIRIEHSASKNDLIK